MFNNTKVNNGVGRILESEWSQLDNVVILGAITHQLRLHGLGRGGAELLVSLESEDPVDNLGDHVPARLLLHLNLWLQSNIDSLVIIITKKFCS